MSAHLILIDALNLIRRIYAVQERPFVQNKMQLNDELAQKLKTKYYLIPKMHAPKH